MTEKPIPIKGTVKRGQILIVEAFPKSAIEGVNEQFARLTGSNPIQGTVGEPSSPLTTKTFAWKVDKLDTLFEALLSSQSVVSMNLGPDKLEEYNKSKKTLQDLVVRVDFLTMDAGDIPFYVAVIRVVLNPLSLPCSQESVGPIQRVRFLFRLLMGDLGGNSGKSAISKPACPAVVFLGVVVNQRDISSLQHDATRLRDPGMEFEESQLISENIRGRLPIRLASIEGADLVSHFTIAPNISLLVGYIDQLALFGIRTPYVMLLSPEEGLLGVSHEEMPVFPIVSIRAFDVIWRGPEMFVIPLACHASIGDMWLRIKGFENELGLASNRLARGSDALEAPDIVDALSKTGVNLAALDVDLGMVDRRVGEALRLWAVGTATEWKELPIPPVGISGRSLIAMGFEGGYASTLANEIAENFKNMKSTVEGLERQTELLFRQVHDSVMRSATQEMKKSTAAVEGATSAMARSQNQVEVLTYVLVTLTISLVALGMWANGWKWQALTVVIGAIVLAGAILWSSRLNIWRRRQSS